MEFQAGDKVLYVPLHCGSDLEHKDVQKGTISESKVQPHLENQFTFVIFDTSGRGQLTPKRLLKHDEDKN